MSTPVRVGAYLAGLAVVFVTALGLGNAVGPVGPASAPEQPTQTHSGHSGTDGDEHPGG